MTTNKARTAAATLARQERVRERRVAEAANTLKAAGWDLCSPAMKADGWKLMEPAAGKAGPILVVDREGDRWALGRDGHYYLITGDCDDVFEIPWTLDEITRIHGLQEQA